MTPSMIKRDNGVVPLVNEGVSMWYGEITVGTPQQQFKGKKREISGAIILTEYPHLS